MALTGSVKIPGLGEIPKKQAAAGAAVLAVILGIVWYRHRAAAAAANAAPAPAGTADQAAAGTGLTSDPYPPDGTIGNSSDPNSTDPATGETYGDEQSGYYGDQGVLGGGDTGATATGTSYTSNAEWSQAAQAQLVAADDTVDSGTIASALGAYITGAPVTSDQQTIIEQAIAFEGYPPVAGPNGQPPSINLAPGGTGSSTGGTTGTGTPPPGSVWDGLPGTIGATIGATPPPATAAAATVTVPSVDNQQVNVAISAITAAGLTYHLSMTRDPSATYIVNSQTPAAGTKVARGSNVDLGIAVHTFPNEAK